MDDEDRNTPDRPLETAILNELESVKEAVERAMNALHGEDVMAVREARNSVLKEIFHAQKGLNLARKFLKGSGTYFTTKPGTSVPPSKKGPRIP